MFLANSRKVHRYLAFLMGVVFATATSIPINAQPKTPTPSQSPTTENPAASATKQPVEALGGQLAVFLGHKDYANSYGAEFSPDGRQILTTKGDNTARLWDIKGNLLAVLRGHEGSVKSAVFSPNGNYILTGSEDGTVRLWNTKGNLIVVFQGHEKGIYRAVFSPNGSQILTTSLLDNTARLWDTSGNLLAQFRGREDWDFVWKAEFSPNGSQILTASYDKTARLWDTKGNLLVVFRGHESSVTSAVFSPDGRQILTISGDNTTRLWDIKGNLLAEFRGHERSPNSAVFSPDGRQILTASSDATARLWDLSAAIAAQSEQMAAKNTAQEGVLTNNAQLAVLRGHEDTVTSAVFSPDGSQILTTRTGEVGSGDNTARLWNTKGNLLVVFRGHESSVTSAVFSPDGNQILTASLDNTARLWDTKGNLLVVFRGHESSVTSAVFSRDGNQILTASLDNTARLWDNKGNLLAVFRGHESSVTSAVFSPDGNQILTASWDKTARLWDISAAIKVSAPEVAFIRGIQLDREGTVESRKLALQKLEEALALYRAHKNHAQALLTLLSIGRIYANLGQFQSALDSYNQALPLSRQAGTKAEQAAILTSLGQLYTDLADPKTALDYYNQALPLCYQLNDKEAVATTLKNMGDIQAISEEWPTALKSYNQSLIVSRYGGDLAAEATALTGIGSTYIALQEWATALHAYNQALLISRHLNDKVKETTILNQLGKIHTALGQNSTALDYYSQALTLSQQLGYKTEEANILYNQATLNRRQNNLTAAKTEIETAINIIESLRTQIASQELRQSYFARNQDYYQFYIDLLMQLHQQNPLQGYDGEALHISERARARSLIELLSEASANIRQGVDPKLIEQERSLQQQLNDFEHRKYELLSTQHTQKELDEIKQKTDTLLAQLKQLEAQIRVTSPRYADLKYPEPLTLQQIQQQVLDDDTLLLEYSLGSERTYLWAVTKTSITSYILPSRSEIEAAAQTFGKSVTQNSAATIDRGLPLSQMLLAPVANQLGNKRLLIVPDGTLQYVPFAALPILSSPTAPLLVQNEIITLSSASTVAIQRRQLQNRSPAAKKIAVVADPIFALNDPRFSSTPQPTPETPANSALTRAVRNLGLGDSAKVLDRLQYTGTEAQKILALAPEAQRLQALGFDASRTTATDPNLAQYQIIHLATHGLLDPVNPELSGIVLSLYDRKGQSIDGFLRLHDIFNLNLPAELVVLSACETGLGKEVKGEGLVGLTRGFMYAGSRRVVVSLWSVNDVATSEVMAKFYQKMLTQGQNPVSALRAAQLEMWNSGQWQSPYYWAAFTVQGDWR